MKIDDLSKNINNIPNLESSGSKNVESDPNNSDTGSGKSVAQGEKVELSTASIEFSKVAEHMDNISKDRIQKIEELKSKVNNGTYDIESEKIAEGIIKDIMISM